MLSRRLLRTKAVQALYASQLSAEANRLLGIDQIDLAFAPDLNSMQPQNRPLLAEMKKQAVLTLDELIKTGEIGLENDFPTSVTKISRQVFQAYKRQTNNDREKMVRRVLNETELIHVDFIRIMSMLIELAYQAQIDRQRTYEDPEAPFPRKEA